MITALVPTYNCESTIRACLESIRWVDYIFVVDSFSTDKTLEICREYTDLIVQHEYINSAAQKNWALPQIKTEWVLQIDSDEVVEPDLINEIKHILAETTLTADGFELPRKNLVWGKWVRSCGIYPDYQLRFFKAQKGRWSNREVHAHVIGLDNVQKFESHLIHDDFTDLSEELMQFSRQVVIWDSNELVKRNHRWRWWDVTLRPLAIFFLLYFYRGGFRDGFRGFFISAYRSIYSFMIYSRLYEIDVKRNIRH